MGWPFGARGEERRSLSFQDVFGTGGSIDLLGNGAEAALRLVPLYAATRLIADQFAAAPLRGYREASDGSTQRMQPQPPLMRSPSAVGHTPFTWKYQCITSLLLRGNATGVITGLDANGYATSVEWLHPDKVSIEDSNPTRPHFYYENRPLDPAGILHIPAYVIAGRWRGVSPIGAFKVAFETGQLAQTSARDWFANGMAPAGHLKNTARKLNPDEAGQVKKRFKAAIANRDMFVSGNDWSFDSIAVAADEARFIETLKLSATQIASIYGVPAEMIGGEAGGSMTYQNVEQQGINLVTYTLRPWFARVEEALTAVMPKPQYAKFNVDAIVRADLKTRMQAHEIALHIGLETQDEGRRLEDKPPLTDQERADWLATYAKLANNPAANPTTDPTSNPSSGGTP